MSRDVLFQLLLILFLAWLRESDHFIELVISEGIIRLGAAINALRATIIHLGAAITFYFLSSMEGARK